MLSEDHDKTPKYQPCHTQTFCRPLLTGVLLRKLTIIPRETGLDQFDLGFPYGRASEARPSFLQDNIQLTDYTLSEEPR